MFVEAVFKSTFGFSYVLFVTVVALYHVNNVFGVAVNVMVNNRVVTRYMGSGITASGSGSCTRDPGSQAMGSGSANFLMSWRGSRINRFLDTLIFIRSKNILFCKEKQ